MNVFLFVGLFSSSLASKMMFNPAPDVDMTPASVVMTNAQTLEVQFEDPDEPRKKKYYHITLRFYSNVFTKPNLVSIAIIHKKTYLVQAEICIFVSLF